MRLSPLNIIMHKSIIWLQQHRKQHPALTFTIYSRSEEQRLKSEDLHTKRLANQDNLCHVDAETLEKEDSGMKATHPFY